MRQSPWTLAAAFLCCLVLGALVVISPPAALAVGAFLLLGLPLILGVGPTPRVAIWLGVTASVAGAQFVLTARTGGAGVLPLFGVATAYVALMAVRRAHMERSVARVLVAGALPVFLWILLSMALLVMGVAVGYPVRTLAGVVAPLGILAFVVIGIVAAQSECDVVGVLSDALVVFSWPIAVLSAIQFASGAGKPVPATEWLVTGLQNRAQDLGSVVVYGRAAGLYLNPNTLSMFGGLCLMVAASGYGLRPLKRVSLALPAAAILLAGQSRAAILAAGAALVVQLVVEVAPGRLGGGVIAKAAVPIALSVAAVWTVVAQYLPPVSDSIGARFGRIAGVVSTGATADTSVSGRLGFWNLAIAQFVQHPFGSLGPPQLLVASGLDSEYIASLLQGGVIYLASGLWVLGRLLMLSLRGNRFMSPGMITFYALAGVSQSVTPMAASGVFWLLAGAALCAGSASTTAAHEPSARKA